MKPTGENLKQFVIFISKRDWIFDLDGKTFINPYDYFVMLPFEMQIGVYLAYYDSLGLDMRIKMVKIEDDSFLYYCGVFGFTDEKAMLGRNIINMFYECRKETRNEAYKEAFKKANEIINQRLKG
jgi:hypothetical protein